jgi:hypothetical protein
MPVEEGDWRETGRALTFETPKSLAIPTRQATNAPVAPI